MAAASTRLRISVDAVTSDGNAQNKKNKQEVSSLFYRQ